MKITQSVLTFGGILVLATVLISGTANACGLHEKSKEVKAEQSQSNVQEKRGMEDGRKLVLLREAGVEVFGPPAPEPEPATDEK